MNKGLRTTASAVCTALASVLFPNGCHVSPSPGEHDASVDANLPDATPDVSEGGADASDSSDAQADAACDGGACAAGQSCCSGACIDTMFDPGNCGACGRQCVDGETCTHGVCLCPLGHQVCHGSCIDTQSDAANCGACDNACTGGQKCVAGNCVDDADAGLDAADDADAMDAADAETCDGMVCPSGQSCCDGRCTDTTRDPQNCGACRNVCPPNNVCEYGCVPCPHGYGGTAAYTDEFGVTVQSTINWVLSMNPIVPNECQYLPDGMGTETSEGNGSKCSHSPNSAPITSATVGAILVIAPPAGPFAGSYSFAYVGLLRWSAMQCCAGGGCAGSDNVTDYYLPYLDGSLGPNGSIMSSGPDLRGPPGASYSVSFTPQ